MTFIKALVRNSPLFPQLSIHIEEWQKDGVYILRINYLNDRNKFFWFKCSFKQWSSGTTDTSSLAGIDEQIIFEEERSIARSPIFL